MNSISEITGKLGTIGTLILGLVIAGIIGYAGYDYVLQPISADLSERRAAAEESEKKVAKLKVLAENREKVEIQGAKIFANYLKGAKLLPNAEQISQVIEAIEGKARENGTEVLSFDAFKLGAKSGGANVYERIVEGELTGSHESLVSFLRSISYFERLTEIKTISATRDERTGREKLKFSLAAYYLPVSLQVPEKMRERAEKMLAEEGFTFNQVVSAQKSQNNPADLASADKK